MNSKLAAPRRVFTTLFAFTAALLVTATLGSTATAAIVATVPLGTSANYSVLAGSTVTNTGASRLHESLGLWPGTSITGFPPGLVIAPGTTDTTNAAAQQAESDLTVAYVNAAGRPLDATTTADLANLTLQSGVYAGPSKGALGLTGPLVLDGAGNANSVFVFQTNSSLTTGSSSTVSLINGAQACNVFWQVGSSATLGTNSVFVGNILALTSVTVTSGVTVQGRALARNGAVTLDDDTFTTPGCATSIPTTTTTTTATTPTTTASGGGTTATTPPGPPAAGTPPTGGGTTLRGGGTPTSNGAGPGIPGVSGPPRTGGGPVSDSDSPWMAIWFGGLLTIGTAEAVIRRRSHLRGSAPATP